MNEFFDSICELLPQGVDMCWITFVDEVVQPQLNTMGLLPHEYRVVWEAFHKYMGEMVRDGGPKAGYYRRCQNLTYIMYFRMTHPEAAWIIGASSDEPMNLANEITRWSQHETQ